MTWRVRKENGSTDQTSDIGQPASVLSQMDRRRIAAGLVVAGDALPQRGSWICIKSLMVWKLQDRLMSSGRLSSWNGVPVKWI